jgi:hypothetical protein
MTMLSVHHAILNAVNNKEYDRLLCDNQCVGHGFEYQGKLSYIHHKPIIEFGVYHMMHNCPNSYRRCAAIPIHYL